MDIDNSRPLGSTVLQCIVCNGKDHARNPGMAWPSDVIQIFEIRVKEDNKLFLRAPCTSQHLLFSFPYDHLFLKK
jgi:hypothetical protein